MKIIVILFLALILTGAKPVTKEMTLNEFYEFLQAENKGINGPFKIKFEGEPEKSHFSGKNYVFYENTVFFGKENIRSTSHTPWCTEKEFFIIYGDIKINIYYKKIRTYLKDSFEKEYTKKNMKDAFDSVKELLEGEADKVLVYECGLEENREYFALFSKEEYHLPPVKDGKPQKRSNLVLWVSDKPFQGGKPQAELTPLYRGWSY